ncbi:MAG: nucleotidyltransferase family protein [Oscillospiraceae bacterium]|nr:nucleotidyltransferase family protein [Oscillospiraceae bacterium]
MKAAGIICEYNPFHIGHAEHIERTRRALGDCAIVCCMSGNFVQRGELAVFAKHARAEAAVLCGADLVVELPPPHALSSAERFARSGVRMLDALRVCEYISFGSESGNLESLKAAARALDTERAGEIIRRELAKGMPYAGARTAAALEILADGAPRPDAPNDMLGVEYLRAIAAERSAMTPLAVRRGSARGGDGSPSASALRAELTAGRAGWERFVPPPAAEIFRREIVAGRAPVPAEGCEAAALSRLRSLGREAYLSLPDSTDGAGERLLRFALREPTLRAVAEGAKTKRYVMSRLKRMIMCACLGITSRDADEPPRYIRVLAANGAGRALLREIKARAGVPVITKPASAKRLPREALAQFVKTAAATDYYVLAYPDERARRGGQEWTTSARIIDTEQ